MNRLKITRPAFTGLRQHLLRGRGADEEAAFLLCGTASHAAGTDLLVREVIEVPPDAMLSQGGSGIEIDPVFIARILKQARLGSYAIVLCHSHPFSMGAVGFSAIDDAGEEVLFPRFMTHVPGVPHGTIVFGNTSLDARVWMPGASGPTPIDEIIVVGTVLEFVKPNSSTYTRPRRKLPDELARQLLAIGDEGQRKLEQMKVGFIGAGGLCSVSFDGAVRLGVGATVITDRDALEKHNVSRVIGAGIADVGQKKADVLAASARRVGLGTHVLAVPLWAQEAAAAAALKDCDVIVVGTDTMKSRVLAARIGEQYLIPVISMGIDVMPSADGIEQVGGHIAVQDPSGPCLDCLELIDHERLKVEHMSREARVANAYAAAWDPDKPQPSVVVFNQVVGGAAGVELLHVATGALKRDDVPTYLMFNGCDCTLHRVLAKALKSCGVCDEVRAKGDAIALPLEVVR
jgi:molybdopterin/thiamine biosynthesis adenylyltransferase